MGDEDDGLVEFALQPQELVLQLLAHHRVDRAERLVHEHHRRVSGQRPGHAHPLLLPPGELVGIPLAEDGVESDTFEQLVRPRPCFRLVPPQQQRDGGDVVEDRAVREEAAALDDVADAAAELVGVEGRGVTAVDLDRAAGGLDHPVDHPQRCGLAAAGRADQHGDLARGGGQAEPADRCGAAGVHLGDIGEADHGVPLLVVVATDGGYGSTPCRRNRSLRRRPGSGGGRRVRAPSSDAVEGRPEGSHQRGAARRGSAITTGARLTIALTQRTADYFRRGNRECTNHRHLTSDQSPAVWRRRSLRSSGGKAKTRFSSVSRSSVACGKPRSVR